jgi:hypothetical protein
MISSSIFNLFTNPVHANPTIYRSGLRSCTLIYRRVGAFMRTLIVFSALAGAFAATARADTTPNPPQPRPSGTQVQTIYSNGSTTFLNVGNAEAAAAYNTNTFQDCFSRLGTPHTGDFGWIGTTLTPASFSTVPGQTHRIGAWGSSGLPDRVWVTILWYRIDTRQYCEYAGEVDGSNSAPIGGVAFYGTGAY